MFVMRWMLEPITILSTLKFIRYPKGLFDSFRYVCNCLKCTFSKADTDFSSRII